MKKKKSLVGQFLGMLWSFMYQYAFKKRAEYLVNFLSKYLSTVNIYIYIYILHLVIWQTLLSKATYNWGIHKAIHLEEAIRQRKCS